MQLKQTILRSFFVGAVSITLAHAQQNPPADNTKANKGDNVAGAVTADQQTMNKADRETAKEIRQSIVKDKSLSTYAHNVKIIVQNGTVTLKGPVRSEEEKESIFKKAVAISGDSKVTNELGVTPSKTQMP